MADVTLHAFVDDERRAAAVSAAVARLASGPLAIRAYAAGAERTERAASVDLARAMLDSAVKGATPWDATIDLVTAVTGETIGASLYAVRARPAPPRFALTTSVGALWRGEVIVPPPATRDEAIGVALHRWASALRALLLALAGAAPDGAPLRVDAITALEEDASSDPFDALAVLRATDEQLALDFARGWLAARGSASVGLAGRDELRRRVLDAGDAPPRRSASAPPRYDGSLAKREVLRLLDLPASAVAQAIEAAAVPDAAVAERVAVGETLQRALDEGAPRAEVHLDPARVPFAPRAVRLPGGGVVMHAGPMQSLWPIYRDAAALLLA